MRKIALAVGLTAALAVSALVPACAVPYALTDLNSGFQLDPASSSGATYWSVDGVDYLFKQQWYYRLDTTSPEYAINNLGAPVVTQPTARDLYATYTLPTFQVELYYGLTGGAFGSGTSDVSERFRITNTSSNALAFYLFQFSDFDLMPNSNDDTAQYVNPNTVRQWDSGYVVTESVSRTPDRWEINYTNTLHGKLTDGDADDLMNGLASFTGDAAWAFQWNLVVPGYGSVVFSKDKYFEPIPEPGCMTALAVGLAAMGVRIRRRR